MSSDAARRRRDNRAGYVFLLPWLIGFFALVAGPVIASGYFSFTDFDLLDVPNWVGVQNYIQLFTTDQHFWNSVRATVVYVVLSVPIRLVVALLLAVLLNRTLKAGGLFKAILYLPSLLGGSVAIAVLWRQVFGGDGLVNQLLAVFGVQGPSWVSDPSWALLTLVALAAWQFGSPMVIFLAGLRQVPGELLEAASVDGAGSIRRFFSITWPLLTPIVFFNLVMQTIVAFQSFTPAFVVSGGTGGPVDSTLFYSLYVYQLGFGQFKMGYASAMAWLLLLCIAAVTVILFATSRLWVFQADMTQGRRPAWR